MQQQSLLAVFAHPDDESFGVGGAMAHYAQQGVHVTLICATRGEVGEISDPSLATPETLAEVREGELRQAVAALGVDDLVFLDYRDSGMEGTPENQDPRAFVNVPAGEVVAKLVGHIRRLRPQVVVTFDPTGGYGHPDHLAVHRHTVTAFHAAGDPAQFSEQGEPWQPARLLFTAVTRSFFQTMREQMQAAGVDTSDFDGFEEYGVADDQIQIVLDVSNQFEAKQAALNAHATQFGENNPFKMMPPEVTRRMMSQEQYIQAWPEPQPGYKATDLFADV